MREFLGRKSIKHPPDDLRCGNTTRGPLPSATAFADKMEELPDDLMEREIFNRLDIASWGRCKAVCQRWKSLLSKEDLDSALRHGYRCMGSFGSWLILIIKLECEVHACLFNPLSLEHRSLPPLDWIDDVEHFYLLARMSCEPTESNLSLSKCGVVVFVPKKMYMCKPTENEWTEVPIDDVIPWEESEILDATILFNSDRLFVFFMDLVDANMMVFYVEGNVLSTICYDVEKVVGKVFGNEGGVRFNFHLVVDCSAGLHVLARTRENNIGATRIVVLKLQRSRLVGVDNLGGGMIFMSGCGSHCSKGACESGFFVKDCIFYVDELPLSSGYRVTRFPVNQPSSFTVPKVYSFFPKEENYWFPPMIT